MQYKSIKGFTGLGQFGILMVFVALGMILTLGVQFVIGMQMIPAGTSMDKMGEAILKASSDPANVGKMQLMQIAGTFFLMFVPCVLYMWVCHGKNFFWLGFSKRINIQQIVLAFAIMYVANLLANPLKELSEMAFKHFPDLNTKAIAAEKTFDDQVSFLSNMKGWGSFALAIVITAFFPAMFEEILFRGALQNLLTRWWQRAILSILVTSIIFSLIHLSYFLFLSRVVLGFALGWMFYRSKNIWVNIIAHFLNNAVALSALFYMSMKKTTVDISQIDTPQPLWTGFIWLAVSDFFMLVV